MENLTDNKSNQGINRRKFFKSRAAMAGGTL